MNNLIGFFHRSKTCEDVAENGSAVCLMFDGFRLTHAQAEVEQPNDLEPTHRRP
jgi:hypothetical protein